VIVRKDRAVVIALLLGMLSEMTPACSSNNGPAAPVTPPSLGDLCSDAAGCATGQCLLQPANLQGIAGLCSLTCISPTGCGPAGACISSLRFGHMCFRTCYASSDCAPGVPCVYQVPESTGVCTPVPSSHCSDFVASTSDPCSFCAGTMCCAESEACAADVTCGRLLNDYPGAIVCDAGNPADPPDPAACALLGCTTTHCGGPCM
jgi:hypothetical protein